jgi:hypothetical protein
MLPPAPNFPAHFPVGANPYAAGPVVFPPGTFRALAGQVWDGMALAYAHPSTILTTSEYVRVTW